MSAWFVLLAAATSLDSNDYAQFQLTDAESAQILSADYSACVDASRGVTASIRDCSETEDKRLDTLLNQEYQATLRRLTSNKARKILRNSQSAWLKVRYQHCNQLAEPEDGGTLWLLIMDDCALQEDTRRIGWLKRYGR